MRKPLLSAVVAALTLGALTCGAAPAGAAPAAGCTADDNTIYQPPVSVAAAPGTVLACKATTLTQVPGNIPMTAWKVQYASTDVAGKPIAVAETVAVPTAPWTGGGARPVVAFNPGTLGLGNQCAFSKQLSGAYQDEYEGDQIAAILKAGWAVAATDGVGYLNGQTHPYVVGADSAHAMLDGTRAALGLSAAGLSKSAPVGLWGYSEGGAASLWAAQLATSYAPDLHVVGDASGGVPGDLKVTASGLNGGLFAGFLTDAVIGLSAAYPAMPFDTLLNSAGRDAVAKAKTQCLIGTVTNFAGAQLANYTTDHLTLDQIYALTGADGRTWGQVVDAQRLGVDIGPGSSTAKYRIPFPVMQFRGVAEEIIPTATEDATRKAYCDAGVTTQWNTYLGDHLLADNEAISDVVSWLGQRFSGQPALGNCLS